MLSLKMGLPGSNSKRYRLFVLKYSFPKFLNFSFSIVFLKWLLKIGFLQKKWLTAGEQLSPKLQAEL